MMKLPVRLLGAAMLCGLIGGGCGGGAPSDNHAGRSPMNLQPAEAARYEDACARLPHRLAASVRRQMARDILIEPRAAQIERWRPLAYCARDPHLRAEALRQLALLDDPAAARLAVLALEHRDHGVRATSGQVLAHVGFPAASFARPALLRALASATVADRPQLVWALVVLEEPRALPPALDLWARDLLAGVRGLEGRVAFDPAKLAALVDPADRAALAADPRPSVRALMATAFPAEAPIQTLTELLASPNRVVAAKAAVGLVAAGDPGGRQQVMAALRRAKGDQRLALLEALRDRVGAAGLVLALDALATEPEQLRWFEYQRIFRMLRQLADPRVGDALIDWLASRGANAPLHWQTEAALRLAEVGDLRAAPWLAQRLRLASVQPYPSPKAWQRGPNGHLGDDDGQRIRAARRLGDLAIMHPAARRGLASAAAGPVMEWLEEGPLPHPAGIRFLAAVHFDPALGQLRGWAFSAPSATGSSVAVRSAHLLQVAPTALRELGRFGDRSSLPRLISALGRPAVGLAVTDRRWRRQARHEMARAAADGIAWWGADAGELASGRLGQIARDEGRPRDVRLAACGALAEVISDESMAALIDELGTAVLSDTRLASCLAHAVARRGRAEHGARLVELLRDDLDPRVQMSLAGAIGACGLGWDQRGFAAERSLLALLGDPQRGDAAALALLLGGSSDGALRAAAALDRGVTSPPRAVRAAYAATTAGVSRRQLERGSLYRWVANAQAISEAPSNRGRVPWEARLLAQQLREAPAAGRGVSLSRPVLRFLLVQAAEQQGSESAVRTLWLMGERGALMALASGGASVRPLAARLL